MKRIITSDVLSSIHYLEKNDKLNKPSGVAKKISYGNIEYSLSNIDAEILLAVADSIGLSGKNYLNWSRGL